jgi:GntR family transcriptional regulator
MFEDIDSRSPTPLWGQIASRVRVAVASGELRPGEPLPSVRELARRLRVNPATVARAYKDLVNGGFAETRHGAGSFVREVGLDRRSKERKLGAEELVQQMLQKGARMGINVEEIVEAFEAEVGSTVHG